MDLEQWEQWRKEVEARGAIPAFAIIPGKHARTVELRFERAGPDSQGTTILVDNEVRYAIPNTNRLKDAVNKIHDR